MNIEARLAKYLERDFSPEQAQTLVLMEEAAIALFAALPEHFVMFGGATLVLFRNSPRLSKDLDLLARVDHLPSSEDLQNALEERMQELAGIFGVGPVTFEPEQNGEQFLRLWIIGSKKQRLFTVDLTRIGGSVLAKEIVEEKIVLDDTLSGHLNDLVMWRELYAEQINERIEQITPELCRAELKSVLPEQVYAKLESEEFNSLRAAIKSLFAEWL